MYCQTESLTMKLYISLNSRGGGGGGGGYIININYISMMVNINYNDSFVSAMRGVCNCWLNGFDSNTWLSDAAADGSDNNEDCTDSYTWLSDSADLIVVITKTVLTVILGWVIQLMMVVIIMKTVLIVILGRVVQLMMVVTMKTELCW